jgi:hypothetical protein
MHNPPDGSPSLCSEIAHNGTMRKKKIKFLLELLTTTARSGKECKYKKALFCYDTTVLRGNHSTKLKKYFQTIY